MDGAKAKLKIVVCTGPSCSVNGSGELLQWCEDLKAAGLELACDVSGCTDNCLESPVVQWNGRYLTEMTTGKMTEQMIESGDL